MSYMYPVKTFRKTVVEKRRLYIDYTCFLAPSEVLTELQAIIQPYTSEAALSVNSSYTDATKKKLTVYVGGGLKNTTYTIQMVVKTNEGQTKRDDIGIVVVP